MLLLLVCFQGSIPVTEITKDCTVPRNTSIPTPWGLTGNSEGSNYKNKLEFQGGGGLGVQAKNKIFVGQG